MTKYFVNNTEKIRIFSVRVRSFFILNDLNVLNGSYVNDISLVAILFSCYKGIYRYKLVNTPPVGAYAFIQSANILFTPLGLQKSL